MNKLGAAVAANQKQRFEPVDMKLMARDLALINKQFQQTLALSSQLRNALKATGQSGAHISQIDFSKLSTDPKIAQRMRDRAFLHAVRGSALDPTAYNETDGSGNIIPPAPGGGGGNGGGSGGSGGSGGNGGGGGGSRPPRGGGSGKSPKWRQGRLGKLGGGIADAVGAGEAVDALGSAAANPMVLVGMVVAADAAAIAKNVKAGYELAKQRDKSFDIIKRQMGDNGISFDALRAQADVNQSGTGLNPGEFGQLAGSMMDASHGAYGSPEELMRAAGNAGTFARSFGADANSTGSIFAGMTGINKRQDQTQFANILAEAIVLAQGKATANEIMQAIYQNASTVSRRSLTESNDGEYAGRLSDLLGSGYAGMTPDVASSIMRDRDSAFSRGGGKGEASQNLIFQALNTSGVSYSPIEERFAEEAGPDSNPALAFAENTPVIKYLRSQGKQGNDEADKLQGKGIKDDAKRKEYLNTTFGERTQNFLTGIQKSANLDPEVALDQNKNLWGQSSYGRAAALVSGTPWDGNDFSKYLSSNGIKPSSSSLQTESQIYTATGDQLRKLYGDLSGRGVYSDDQRKSIEGSLGKGDFDGARLAMMRGAASAGMGSTQASDQKDAENEKLASATLIGEKIIPAMTMIDKALNAQLAPMQALKNAADALTAAIKGTPAGSGSWLSQGLDWLKSQGQDGSTPLGIRSNNPLNMLTNGKENTYADATSGIADATANLERGYRGLTLAQIQDKWTGGARTGNTPEMIANYTKLMTGATGLKAGDVPDLNDPKMVASVMKGMIRAENGKMPYSDEQIDAGVGAGMARAKIPAKDRARASAKYNSNGGGPIPGTTETRDPNGDIIITLNQTVTAPGGGTKTKKITTTVPLPSSSGEKFGTIIEIPGK